MSQSKGYFIVNGKRLDAFNVQIDAKPQKADQEEIEQLKAGLRQLRHGIHVTCNWQQGSTGPIVEGSIEKEQEG